MPETHDSPQLLTTQQVAEKLGVGVRSVRRLAETERLRPVQQRPKMLFDPEDVEQFLRQRTSPAQVISTTSKDEGQDADIHQSMPAVAFSRKDAAVLLGVHPDTINRWRRQGRLQATPEGLIPLAEIKRLTAATTPSSGTQLELLGDPVLPSPTLAGEVPPALTSPLVSPNPATAREAAPALTPSWSVLVHLLEASYQREAKLAEQLDVVNTLLLRLVDPSGPRSSILSGHGDPLTPPLTEQVLAFLREHPGPHRSVEVRDVLGLPHSPKNTLQSLFRRGLVERLAPGVFQAIPDDKPSSPPEPAEGTLLAQVLAYVRERTGDDSKRRGVRSWQVEQALDLSQSANRTLTRLVERKLLYRIGKGLYSARPEEVVEEKDITKQVTEES
jgi:excisionase family DNA binding protein